MRAKIISKLTIAQLACLPLISISCGKHEQKAKENLVAVASSPKFDKLIDKNKENKTDKVAPIVEKIEVVNNGESESKQIEKSKKVEINNPNNPNSPINVEVKNDIKIDNKINTKESELKTFFAVVGGLATAVAVGYGLWWLFKDEKYYEISSQTENNVTEIYSDSKHDVTVTIKYRYKNEESGLKTEINTKNGFTIISTTNTVITINNNGNSERKVIIKGPCSIIYKLISKYTSEITTLKIKSTTNWERLLKKLKEFFNNLK